MGEWVQWAAKERTLWIEDYAPDKDKQMEFYWLPRPWVNPVIVVEGADKLFYAWDGNHRIGVALSAGRSCVPAIVGLRKT